MKRWNTIPTSRRMALTVRSSGWPRRPSFPVAASGMPLTVMVPASMVSRQLRVLRSVVFPEPLGPMITTTSPGATSRVTPRSTSRVPNRFHTSRTSISAFPLTRASTPPVPLTLQIPSCL